MAALLFLFWEKMEMEKGLNLREFSVMMYAENLQEGNGMGEIYTKVAGVTFDNSDGTSRQAVLSSIAEGETLNLKDDSSVRYPEAIGVYDSIGQQLGFLPSDVARKVRIYVNSEDIKYIDVEARSVGSNDGKPLGCFISMVCDEFPDDDDEYEYDEFNTSHVQIREPIYIPSSSTKDTPYQSGISTIIDGVMYMNKDGKCRQEILKEIHAGENLYLRYNSSGIHPKEIEVYDSKGQQLGCLPKTISETLQRYTKVEEIERIVVVVESVGNAPRMPIGCRIRMIIGDDGKQIDASMQKNDSLYKYRLPPERISYQTDANHYQYQNQSESKSGCGVGLWIAAVLGLIGGLVWGWLSTPK